METTLQADTVTEADIAPIVERLVTPYLQEVLPESFADPHWQKQWENRMRGWLADHTVRLRKLQGDGEWMGFAACRLVDRDGERIAEVLDVYVTPSARRHGHGSHLVEDVMAWAAHSGAREMAIAIKVRHQVAVDFFAQLGFSPQRLLLTRWI